MSKSHEVAGPLLVSRREVLLGLRRVVDDLLGFHDKFTYAMSQIEGHESGSFLVDHRAPPRINARVVRSAHDTLVTGEGLDLPFCPLRVPGVGVKLEDRGAERRNGSGVSVERLDLRATGVEDAEFPAQVG